MTRILDIFVALVALIILSPLLFLCLIAIRLESSGSPIFRQVRVGKNGNFFHIFKLRSMRINAEKMGPLFTSKNDPRITYIGKFLRQTSIDELPQLWNVIVGDMSIVGPRPATPDQRHRYSSTGWRRRHQVCPGITGLAQVVNRSSGEFKHNRRLDLLTVKSASKVCFYCFIILRTATVLVSQKNVN